MTTIVTVGHFDSVNIADVSRIVQDFDANQAKGFPRLLRRQLYSYSDLYIHVQDWAVDPTQAEQTPPTDPRLVELDTELSKYFTEYCARPIWDGPVDATTASRFYLWPGEHLPDYGKLHSAVIVNTQRHADILEVSRLFADLDSTDFPHKMGTLRRQIFLYRGIYLHIQDFASDDSREVIDDAWKEADPRFLQIVDDLTPIVPPYDAAGGQLADCFYRWAGE
ncbi:TcmI family type II polyketide cyclase [Nocardia nova]|uniref:TcmI family type II polyketide cyclase n=1 Tax=Nocardia nova TaxID=37330 RepID=UPI0033DF0567